MCWLGGIRVRGMGRGIKLEKLEQVDVFGKGLRVPRNALSCCGWVCPGLKGSESVTCWVGMG